METLNMLGEFFARYVGVGILTGVILVVALETYLSYVIGKDEKLHSYFKEEMINTFDFISTDELCSYGKVRSIIIFACFWPIILSGIYLLIKVALSRAKERKQDLGYQEFCEE